MNPMVKISVIAETEIEDDKQKESILKKCNLVAVSLINFEEMIQWN